MARADMDRDAKRKAGETKAETARMVEVINESRLIGHCEGMCTALRMIEEYGRSGQGDTDTARAIYARVHGECSRIHRSRTMGKPGGEGDPAS